MSWEMRGKPRKVCSPPISQTVFRRLWLYGFTLVPSTGYPSFFQAASPPSSAAALSYPFVLSSSTAPALVCSFGQVQYAAINFVRGNSLRCSASEPVGTEIDPLMCSCL